MLYSKGVCTEVQLGGIDIFEPCLGESECPLWVSDGLDGSQLRILFFHTVMERPCMLMEG